MNGSILPSKGKDIVLRNRGISTSGCLVFLILLGLLGFVGFKVGQAYWNYYNVKEQVREALVWAVGGMQPGVKPTLSKGSSPMPTGTESNCPPGTYASAKPPKT